MQEYLILIQAEGDPRETMGPVVHQEHIRKCGEYIARLKEAGKFFSAQPLQLKGALLEGSKGVIKDGPFNETKEVIVGYYHIQAESLEEAVEIAKENPVFQDFTAKIEVRPILKEEGIN